VRALERDLGGGKKSLPLGVTTTVLPDKKDGALEVGRLRGSDGPPNEKVWRLHGFNRQRSSWPRKKEKTIKEAKRKPVPAFQSWGRYLLDGNPRAGEGQPFVGPRDESGTSQRRENPRGSEKKRKIIFRGSWDGPKKKLVEEKGFPLNRKKKRRIEKRPTPQVKPLS